MQADGTYFDGETAADHAVTVRLEDACLAISGP
jgi:hypothetical protein